MSVSYCHPVIFSKPSYPPLTVNHSVLLKSNKPIETTITKKKNCRRTQNRESAQRLRDNEKEKISLMEKSLEKFTQQCGELEKQRLSLKNENVTLNEALEELVGKVNKIATRSQPARSSVLMHKLKDITKRLENKVSLSVFAPTLQQQQQQQQQQHIVEEDEFVTVPSRTFQQNKANISTEEVVPSRSNSLNLFSFSPPPSLPVSFDMNYAAPFQPKFESLDMDFGFQQQQQQHPQQHPQQHGYPQQPQQHHHCKFETNLLSNLSTMHSPSPALSDTDIQSPITDIDIHSPLCSNISNDFSDCTFYHNNSSISSSQPLPTYFIPEDGCYNHLLVNSDSETADSDSDTLNSCLVDNKHTVNNHSNLTEGNFGIYSTKNFYTDVNLGIGLDVCNNIISNNEITGAGLNIRNSNLMVSSFLTENLSVNLKPNTSDESLVATDLSHLFCQYSDEISYNDNSNDNNHNNINVDILDAYNTNNNVNADILNIANNCSDTFDTSNFNINSLVDCDPLSVFDNLDPALSLDVIETSSLPSPSTISSSTSVSSSLPSSTGTSSPQLLYSSSSSSSFPDISSPLSQSVSPISVPDLVVESSMVDFVFEDRDMNSIGSSHNNSGNDHAQYPDSYPQNNFQSSINQSSDDNNSVDRIDTSLMTLNRNAFIDDSRNELNISRSNENQNLSHHHQQQHSQSQKEKNTCKSAVLALPQQRESSILLATTIMMHVKMLLATTMPTMMNVFMSLMMLPVPLQHLIFLCVWIKTVTLDLAKLVSVVNLKAKHTMKYINANVTTEMRKADACNPRLWSKVSL
eukprot:Awhi_evm1s10085